MNNDPLDKPFPSVQKETVFGQMAFRFFTISFALFLINVLIIYGVPFVFFSSLPDGLGKISFFLPPVTIFISSAWGFAASAKSWQKKEVRNLRFYLSFSGNLIFLIASICFLVAAYINNWFFF